MARAEANSSFASMLLSKGPAHSRSQCELGEEREAEGEMGEGCAPPSPKWIQI